MLNIGLGKESITPPFGVSLAGYFNARPNRGVLDDTCVRAMVMEKNGKKSGFLVFDLCNLCSSFIATLRIELRAAGIDFANDVILSAIHTHTGSNLRPKQMDDITCYASVETIAAAVRAMKRAVRSMAPAELLYAEHNGNPFGYVRRYFMKNGSVVTNPTRCNPDIVKPESDFDKHIRVLAIRQEGRISALMVNLANHCDTIGGDFVSADWPGRMEAAIQYQLKSDIPVFSLIDASGNINHFDVSRNINQTNYDEAVRIGRGYAEIVTGMLDKLTPISEGEIAIRHSKVEIFHRVIPPADYAKAKQYLEDTKNAAVTGGDLTSEGLANGDVTVLRYFAQRLLDCADKSTKSEIGELTTLNLGDTLAFITLPGEPFNGISQAIRKASPYKHTLVVELAESQGTYIPMRDCFDRGGYETQPGINTVAPDSSDVMIAAAIANLR